MRPIEFERWKPSADDPKKMEYDGQRTAQEIFEELKHRLEITGYLPDEYFLMDREWEDGRKIPKDADIFCTTDYGGSEGVYLDVYLKWHEEDGSPVTKSFITGKTLGENGNDLDRMFLISSAITKAFHGDHATHARYMKIDGVEDDTGGAVVHLSQREQRTIIEALIEQRERQEAAMSQTEQLLRRMTGSITAFINEVGARPLRMSDYDKAVLAIRDGELEAFKEYAAKVPYQQEENLLVEAAGRPGAVGRKMTELLIQDRCNIDYAAYCNACKKAIDINDPQKVLFMMEQAQTCVPELAPSFYGEMASYAYLDHRFIAREIIHQCGEDQIAAAPSRLLEQFAADHDYRTLSELVEKGISGGASSARTLHMLTYGGHDSWIAENLLEKRMWVDPGDYTAFHACVQNDAVKVCKLLLDHGMDFEQYQTWAATHQDCVPADTLRELEAHWRELTEQGQEQSAAPQMGGMDLG